ncbi:MAG: HIT domain-containing protein [Pseudomonadales bacterium]|nr:HIT domain-containing protein [Pseudomonadales bacterium]
MTYDANNVFAKILRNELPAYVIDEDEHTLSFMDLMPLQPGHCLVICKEPAIDLLSISAIALARVHQQSQRVARAADRAFNPDGVTIAQLTRSGAGQSVFHFHVHVVPTWGGLLDFRGHARVRETEEALSESAQRLRDALRD